MLVGVYHHRKSLTDVTHLSAPMDLKFTKAKSAFGATMQTIFFSGALVTTVVGGLLGGWWWLLSIAAAGLALNAMVDYVFYLQQYNFAKVAKR